MPPHVRMHYDDPVKAESARRLVAAGLSEPQAVAVTRVHDWPDRETLCKELIEAGFTLRTAEAITECYEASTPVRASTGR